MLCALAAGGYFAWSHFWPSIVRVSWHDYHTEYDPDGLAVVTGNLLQPASVKPIVRNGVPYLPVSFVRETLDPHLFLDDAGERIIITTPTRVIRMRTDELTYYVNSAELRLPLSALRVGGTAYLPASILTELYHIDIAYHENTGMVVLDELSAVRALGTTTPKEAHLRFEADAKAPVLQTLAAGTALALYGEADGWLHVRTPDGLLGYIPSKDVDAADLMEGIPEPMEYLPALPLPANGGKLNIVWDQMETHTAAANADRRVMQKGLDVISPTWFSFDLDSLNGDLISIADKGYVDWAHKNGLQVWGLITDNFNPIVSEQILSDSDKREHIIRQLLALSAAYNLDGINIDFEMVRRADVAHFHQFLRELAPMVRAQNLVLSVDVYVPRPYSLYYDRAELARIADYLIIFGYDEHDGSSKVAGPVASIGFVRDGVAQTVAEAPPEKVILGIPYYVRIWREINGEVESSRAVGMDFARRILDENNADIVWDEANGCYYGEYTVQENGVDVRYRVWLEDSRSLTEKLKVVEEYGIAGIAGWRKGLEQAETWELLWDALGKEE